MLLSGLTAIRYGDNFFDFNKYLLVVIYNAELLIAKNSYNPHTTEKPIRSHLFLNPAIIFVNFVASVRTSTSKQPIASPPPLSTPKLSLLRSTQVSNNMPATDPEFSCHITPILHSLHWLKIIECIEYKILFITHKVLTTSKPSYLHHLITVQPHPSLICGHSFLSNFVIFTNN